MTQKISYDENSEAWSMKRKLSHGLLKPCCLKVMLSCWFLINFVYASKTSGHVKKRTVSSRIGSWHNHNYCLGTSFATKTPEVICILRVFIHWGAKAFLLYHFCYEDRCGVNYCLGTSFATRRDMFSMVYSSTEAAVSSQLGWLCFRFIQSGPT